MKQIETNQDAYQWGRKMFAFGIPLGSITHLINKRVPKLNGFGHWAAWDGFAHARRSIPSKHWIG